MSGIKNNKEVYSVLQWQLILVMGLALILFLFQGVRGGTSALLGGLACWLPTWAFVWRVFQYNTPRTAKKFVIAFVIGEVLKLMLSGVLFVLILKYLPVELVPVLMGFVGAVAAFWLASMVIFARHERVAQ